MPKTVIIKPPPTRKDSRRTWNALIASAIRILHRDGYSGLSFRNVCREAGLKSHGALLRHFESKDALAMTALAYMHQAGTITDAEHIAVERWIVGGQGRVQRRER